MVAYDAIGGDSAYGGAWGPVMSWHDASEVVGKSVRGGVLAGAEGPGKQRSAEASSKAMTSRRRYGCSRRMHAELMESNT